MNNLLRKTYLVIMVFLLVAFMLHGQPGTGPLHGHTLKLNSAALPLKNLSLFYEYPLDQHWALLLGAGYKWGGKIPKVLGLGNFLLTSDTRGLRGYSVTPELRYYFDFCGCGGSQTGFYTGLYTRLTRLDGDLRFNYWNGTEYMDVGGAANFRELGVGLQLGYQFRFRERFVVDLMFAGPRSGWNRIKFSVDSHFASEVIPLIEEEINKRLDWLGYDPITIPVSAEAEARFRFTNFRYAVAFGYRF